MIRDYKVFTSKAYKIAFLLIEPIVFMMGIFIACVFRHIDIAIAVFAIFMMAEIFQDYFSIGCICKKNDMGMEYIKTSFRGKQLIKNAIIVDNIVKVIKPLIVAVVGTMPYVLYEGMMPFGSILINLMFAVILALDCSFISIASTNITRYIDTFNIMGISSIPIIAVGILLLIPLSMLGYLVAPIIMIILVVVASVGTLMHMNYKIEKSYFDIE